MKRAVVETAHIAATPIPDLMAMDIVDLLDWHTVAAEFWSRMHKQGGT